MVTSLIAGFRNSAVRLISGALPGSMPSASASHKTTTVTERLHEDNEVCGTLLLTRPVVTEKPDFSAADRHIERVMDSGIGAGKCLSFHGGSRSVACLSLMPERQYVHSFFRGNKTVKRDIAGVTKGNDQLSQLR